jgi:hypothetical protein
LRRTTAPSPPRHSGSRTTRFPARNGTRAGFLWDPARRRARLQDLPRCPARSRVLGRRIADSPPRRVPSKTLGGSSFRPKASATPSLLLLDRSITRRWLRGPVGLFLLAKQKRTPDDQCDPREVRPPMGFASLWARSERRSRIHRRATLWRRDPRHGNRSVERFPKAMETVGRYLNPRSLRPLLGRHDTASDQGGPDVR